jgi:hypothetical protein
VDVHLAGCEHCTAYLEQLRQTIRLTGRLRERDLAPELRAVLLAAFREFDREERR